MSQGMCNFLLICVTLWLLCLKLNRDFAWSPTDSIISYWTCEEGDMPARVTLIEIPSRVHLCTKNLFGVADCKLHWQKSGQYLCVKVDRYKSKKEEKEKEMIKYAVRLTGLLKLVCNRGYL